MISRDEESGDTLVSFGSGTVLIGTGHSNADQCLPVITLSALSRPFDLDSENGPTIYLEMSSLAGAISLMCAIQECIDKLKGGIT